jgi:hypothetical protein
MSLILADYAIERNYSFAVGKYQFGFADADQTFEGEVTLMQLGPFGEFHHVPFSAAQGWLMVTLIFVGLLAALTTLGVRFRRRHG